VRIGGLLFFVVLMGFGFAVYTLGKSAHSAGNQVGSVLVSPIDKATLAAAEANLESADRAAQTYYVDNNFSYAGLTTATLQQQIAGGLANVIVAQAGASSYCLEALAGGVAVAHQSGPNGVPFAGPC
jgi:hypothetical protein